jgi:hypothetical protein
MGLVDASVSAGRAWVQRLHGVLHSAQAFRISPLNRFQSSLVVLAETRAMGHDSSATGPVLGHRLSQRLHERGSPRHRVSTAESSGFTTYACLPSGAPGQTGAAVDV